MFNFKKSNSGLRRYNLFSLLLFILLSSLFSVSAFSETTDAQNNDNNLAIKEALQSCDLNKLENLLSEKKVDIDRFLEVSLLGYLDDAEFADCTDRYQNRLVKMAIDAGANPNSPNIFSNTIKQYTPVNPATVETLFTKIDPKLFCHHLGNMSTAGYTKSYFVANDMYYFIHDPILLADIRYKNLDAKPAASLKIPRIMHHIWVTNEKTRREIPEKDIGYVLDTKQLFSEKWQHIVWTNDRSLIPKSVKELESNGVEVREISEVKQYMTLDKKIDELIEQGRWGMASDTIRYELLKHFGGVYADLNFIFDKNIEEELYKYDFFTQPHYHSVDPIFFSNCFFGAKPNHPILSKAIRIVDRNFNNPPKYIADLGTKGNWLITTYTTLEPLMIAYYTTANKNGNIDVVYPNIPPDIDHYRYASIYSNYEREFQRIDMIKKHVDCTEKVDFFKSYLELFYYMDSHRKCYTTKYIGCDTFGEGSWSWLNPEWDGAVDLPWN